jgi:hypothetical protein
MWCGRCSGWGRSATRLRGGRELERLRGRTRVAGRDVVRSLFALELNRKKVREFVLRSNGRFVYAEGFAPFYDHIEEIAFCVGRDGTVLTHDDFHSVIHFGVGISPVLVEATDLHCRQGKARHEGISVFESPDGERLLSGELPAYLGLAY